MLSKTEVAIGTTSNIAVNALMLLRREGNAANGDHVNFAGFDFVRKYPKSECASHLRGSIRRVAVDQNARQLGNLSDPPPVGFLFELDRKRHRVRRNYDIDSRRLLAPVAERLAMPKKIYVDAVPSIIGMLYPGPFDGPCRAREIGAA